MRFDQIKSETLNLRVSPSFKLALKTLAERENRSMVNALEYLVLDYFKRNQLAAPPAPSSKAKGEHARGKAKR